MADNAGADAAERGIQSLRDTAKWLVGGVAATAAGVAAGSSLTSLGALDPATQAGFVRLGLAGLGACIGFAGLAVILMAAIRVLTVESLSFRDFVQADAQVDPDLAAVSAALGRRYASSFPAGITSLRSYSEEVDRRWSMEPRDKDDDAFIQAAKENFAVFRKDGGFRLVQRRFDALVRQLGQAAPIAALGFGLFAWAANPPPPAAPPAAGLSLKIEFSARP